MPRRLAEALREERTDPRRARELYRGVARANRLPRWPLALLAFATALGASLVVDRLSVSHPRHLAITATLVILAAMGIPVYVSLWRDCRILDLHRGAWWLARGTVTLSLMVLLLEGLTVAFHVLVGLLAALPVQLLVGATLHFTVAAPWFPSPAEMPWFYIPSFLGAGLLGLWSVMGGQAVEDVFDAPHRYFAATIFAIRDNPADVLLFGGFLGGSAALGGTAFEVPYEAFAAGLPGTLLIFRNGLTGRDIALANLVRLGSIRTSLLLGARDHGGRFWRQGEALWHVERLKTELFWEVTLARRGETRGLGRRNVVETLASPLDRLARYSLGAAARMDTDDVDEVTGAARAGRLDFPGFAPYASEWALTAENTGLLVRRIAARTNQRPR